MFQQSYSTNYYEVPHPHSPYDAVIPHGVFPGKQILIRGKLRHHTDSFSFNLMGHGGHILHINPRFSENAVIRNTETYGAWGGEERHGPFPFTRGGHFELMINIEHHKYHIRINGHSYDYNHRIPYQEVHRLKLEGDMEIHRIVFSGGASNGHEQHNPHVPFSAPIKHGPAPGRMIQIQGVIPHHAEKFSVNLQHGSGDTPGDINLHFNPRFNDAVVVRTNRKYGNWGHEERHAAAFPFHKGMHFDLLILIEPHEFKVAVNGQHFTSFIHRNPLHECNHVGVSGDVVVHSIRQF